MVLICSDPRILQGTLNASSFSTLEPFIVLHVHATPPSNVLKDNLGNHVLYEDEIGRYPRFEGENRQPNAEWVAALSADTECIPCELSSETLGILYMGFDAFVLSFTVQGEVSVR